MFIRAEFMDTPPINLYDFVMENLRSKRISQRQIARESGVPFSTVCKVAQGGVTDPSIHTIQRLADYFAKREPVVGANHEIRLDAVLNTLTTTAMKNAAIAVEMIDGGGAVSKPTSVRLTRRTLVFYDKLATDLGVSRNAVLQMVLEHLVNTVVSAKISSSVEAINQNNQVK